MSALTSQDLGILRGVGLGIGFKVGQSTVAIASSHEMKRRADLIVVLTCFVSIVSPVIVDLSALGRATHVAAIVAVVILLLAPLLVRSGSASDSESSPRFPSHG